MKEQHIIIIGAGFGGVTTAITLEKYTKTNPNVHVTLIDKNHYQLYTPALYEIASMPQENAGAEILLSAVTIPTDAIIASRNIRFIPGTLASINPKEKTITLVDQSQFSYSFLVLALGSETNYFGIPGLEQYSCPLKTFKDGLALRNKIEAVIPEKSGIFTIIIGGAGATGVELAAEFESFICKLQKIYRNERTCTVEIKLIESSETILQGFAPWLVTSAKKRLNDLGIQILISTRILSVKEDTLETSNGKISYDVLIWTGGVRGPHIYESIDLPKNKKWQLITNETLEVCPNIFAVGDNAAFPTPSGKSLPWNVPVAEKQGKTVAKNILHLINGKPSLPYQNREHYPYILAVGKKYAIADLVYVSFSGFPGWLLKQIVELRYLLFILPFFEAIHSWVHTISIYIKND